MKMTTLQELFIHQLRDLYSSEQQFIKVFTGLNQQFGNKDLVAFLQHKLLETKIHAARLEQSFTILGLKPELQICKDLESILKEASGTVNTDPSSQDNAFQSLIKKLTDYKINSYRTAITYAKYLCHLEVCHLLTETLMEEKKADDQFANFAKQTNSQRAER